MADSGAEEPNASETTETEADGEENPDKPQPSHWSKLDPKTMKVCRL